MQNLDKNFIGSIPEFYDTYLVPLIFKEYADDLASRVLAGTSNKILETAAGSGVVTRALANKISSSSEYIVTDLNQPMLDHAQAQQPHRDNLTWQQADALNLPFDDHQFDVVICQFGVMFFPDKLIAYSEVNRVLKPQGRYIFSVWDCIENNVLADLVTQAAGTVFPDDPPMFMS